MKEPVIIKSDLSSRIVGAKCPFQMEWQFFICWERETEKNPVNLSFIFNKNILEDKGKVKTFSDRQKLREIVVIRGKIQKKAFQAEEQ